MNSNLTKIAALPGSGIGGYLDEVPNPVITACGIRENGKVCAERLRFYTGPRPPACKYGVAYCSVHGIVPIFPDLEDLAPAEEAAKRLGYEPFNYTEGS
jgi:hypothetical protein